MAGDEAAMDAILAAAPREATAALVAVVPTAAARGRPDLAAANGERAFHAAAARAGAAIRVTTVPVLTRADAADAALAATLASASIISFPGGDPDLIPAVLRDTPAWSAIADAVGRGACLAGASAGAMALGWRLWTSGGGVAGLGLVPGIAVLPHFAPGRLGRWREAVEDGDAPLTWLGLDEQTLVLGRPGEPWTVAGRGRAHVIPPGSDDGPSYGPGEGLSLP